MIQGQEPVQLLTNAKPTTSQNNPVNVDTMQIVEQFRRLQPPCFEGSIDPLIAEDWVRELEKIFDLIECPDALRVSSAAFMLKGSASHWWDMTKRIHNVEGNKITWAQFKELFYEKYFPQSLKDDKEKEFKQLTQDSMSLTEYERKFEALSRFAPHLVDTEEHKAKRFESGLKPELRKHVSVLELKTYSEVFQKAKILAKADELIEATKSKNEAQIPQQKESWGRNNQKMFDQGKGKKRKQSENSGKKEYPMCDTCQKRHEGSCFMKIVACFKCGKLGHFTSQCPEKKKDLGGSLKDQRTQGRVYTLTAQEARDSPSVVSGTYELVNKTVMANINTSTSVVSLDSLEQGGAHTVDSNMDMPPAPMNQQNITSLDGPVGILWDIENCCVPSDVRPEDVAGNIRMALRVHPVIKGAVMMFSAYGDFNAFPRRLREGCQRTGVKLIDVPNGRKDAADKAILVDMFLFALDNRPPSSIMLISGDVDFAPALHILGQRGYTVIVVVPSGMGVSSALCSAGKFVCDWPSMARGEGFVPPTKSFVPPTKSFVPPCGGSDFAGYAMGYINNNIDASNEEAIFNRGISQSYYKSRDFPIMSQSLSEYTSTSVNMPCFPTNLRTQSLPSVLNEVSAGPVSSADQNDNAMLVQPRDINGLKVQLVKLLELSGGCLPFGRVHSEYQKLYGKPLHASDYGTRKLGNLFKKLGDKMAIEGEGERKSVHLRDWKGGSSAILAKEDEKAKGSQEENLSVTADGEGQRKFVYLHDWKAVPSAILARNDRKAKDSQEENMRVTAGGEGRREIVYLHNWKAGPSASLVRNDKNAKDGQEENMSVIAGGEGPRKFVCLPNWKAGPSAILARNDKQAKGIQEENMCVTAGGEGQRKFFYLREAGPSASLATNDKKS